jgi:hypothetical protein
MLASITAATERASRRNGPRLSACAAKDTREGNEPGRSEGRGRSLAGAEAIPGESTEPGAIGGCCSDSSVGRKRLLRNRRHAPRPRERRDGIHFGHRDTSLVHLVRGASTTCGLLHRQVAKPMPVGREEQRLGGLGKCQDGPQYHFGPVGHDGAMISPEAMMLYCDVKLRYRALDDLNELVSLEIKGDTSVTASMGFGTVTVG